MSDTPRSAVDSTYQFDLTTIYATPADWDEAYAEFTEQIASIDARTPPIESTAVLESLVQSVLASFATKQRLELYADLREKITDDPAATERVDRFRSAETAHKEALATVDRCLTATAGALLDQFVAANPEYERYVRNLQAQARHRRSPSDESLIGAFEQARSAPDRIIQSIKSEAFEAPTIVAPDGQDSRLDYVGYISALESPDRSFRRQAYETYFAAFDRHTDPLFRAYAEKLKSLTSLAVVRGYDSLCDQQLRKRCYPEIGTRQQLSPAVHETLIDAIQNELAPYHRLQDHRRSELGVDVLRPWDLRAPLSSAEPPTIPYTSAIEHVIASVEPLGTQYQERARAFFEHDRADVKPHAGRNNDIGYCPSSIADGPYLFTNYTDDFRSMVVLTHELGHALAVEQLRDRPLQDTATPRAVEEIPSVTHELLLYEYCSGLEGVFGTYGTFHRANSLGGLLFDQARYAAFVRSLAERTASDEPLTRSFADEHYLELHQLFSPTVEFTDASRCEWLNRALQRDPFHHYYYVLGAVGALVVSDRVLSGDWSGTDYRQLCIDMGRLSATELFDSIGLAIHTPAPYRQAATLFDGLLDELSASRG